MTFTAEPSSRHCLTSALPAPCSWFWCFSFPQHLGALGCSDLSRRSSAHLAEEVCVAGRHAERTESLLAALQTQVHTARQCHHSKNHVLSRQDV